MPAERARGARWAEKFESPTHVAKNRGTVAGVVPIDFGATFPAVVGNYISYEVSSILNRIAISFVLDFYPNFAANDGAAHALVDTTIGATYQVIKRSNNELAMYIQTVGYLISATYATFGPYWNISNRNTLVALFCSGNHAMYLNDNLLGTSAAATAVWNPSVLYVGTNASNSAPANSRFTSLKIFTGNTAADLLTAQEAYDYFHNRVF